MPLSKSEPTLRRKLFVAVVDDDEPLRTSIARLLDTLGYATQGFGSVVEFVSSGAVRRADCLLLDVSMPDLDGFALQGCLRGTNYQIPIIFCTGLGDEEAKQRALANGAFSFLQKPVKAELLVETIRAACEAGAKQRSESGPHQP